MRSLTTLALVGLLLTTDAWSLRAAGADQDEEARNLQNRTLSSGSSSMSYGGYG
jgi:hypothetical protein